MFKKFILAVLIVAGAAFAQLQVHVGGRAAVNFGTIWGDNTSVAKWGVGFNAGAIAKTPINPMIDFVSGLEVELRRFSVDWFLYDDWSFAFWYIDVPLLARININPQFFVDAGLNLGFNVVALETTESLGHSTTDDVDGSQTVDLGFMVGAGFNVIPKLDVNVRALLSITNMISYGDDFASKNLRFQAGVTYWFM